MGHVRNVSWEVHRQQENNVQEKLWDTLNTFFPIILLEIFLGFIVQKSERMNICI